MRALLTLLLAIIPLSVLGQADVDLSGASAARPGDENLTCDQLRTEMMAQRQQVDVRGLVEQQRAAALAIAASEQQSQAAQSEETEQREPESAAADDQAEPAADGNRRGGGLLRGAAGAGGGGFGFGRGRGRGDNADEAVPAREEQAAREPAPVEQNQAPSFGAGPPGMARGFRLMELAQAKKCAFLDEGAPPRAPR